MTARRERPLTEGQVTMLFVVSNNGPVSVSDVAAHLLLDVESTRSRLAALERRALIARQYTGHHRGSQYAYRITDTGECAIKDRDDPEEAPRPGECDLCGRTDGAHMRACVLNPDRPRRTP